MVEGDEKMSYLSRCEEIATFSYSGKSRRTSSNTSVEATVLACPRRTQGDGMENVVKVDSPKPKVRLGDALIYHPTDLKQHSTPPVTPTGTIVKLIPRPITQIKKDKYSIIRSLKLKEPKFVPYEPYKAAVKPIIPYTEKKKKITSKNNLDINVMVAQLAISKKSEDNKAEAKEENKDDSDREKEKRKYEAEIQKLKEENSQLENQLKFQAQVNGELKNLLVAAVGEDLQTKVHVLTEDKLQLARALLNSAQHLSTHQEQTEWLAGQCEVWRSKFLASSLMVEELAKWKAALTQRTTDLQESVKRLLEERSRVRDTSFRTYRILSTLRENLDLAKSTRKHELPTTNIIDLGEGCCQLAELLNAQLSNKVENGDVLKEIDITGLEMKTVTEKNAEQLLMSPNMLTAGRQDVACSAVMGAALAVGNQMFFQPRCNITSMTCCPHCNGDVKQV